MTARQYIQQIFPWFPEPRQARAGALTAQRIAVLKVQVKTHEYAAKRIRANLAKHAGVPCPAPAVPRESPCGASGEALLRRKFLEGLADLQVLCLFALAKHELLTLSDLAEVLGVGASAAWHAAERMIDSGYIKKDTLNKPFSVAYFSLSDDGKRKVAWLLGKS